MFNIGRRLWPEVISGLVWRKIYRKPWFSHNIRGFHTQCSHPILGSKDSFNQTEAAAGTVLFDPQVLASLFGPW